MDQDQQGVPVDNGASWLVQAATAQMDLLLGDLQADCVVLLSDELPDLIVRTSGKCPLNANSPRLQSFLAALPALIDNNPAKTAGNRAQIINGAMQKTMAELGFAHGLLGHLAAPRQLAGLAAYALKISAPAPDLIVVLRVKQTAWSAAAKKRFSNTLPVFDHLLAGRQAHRQTARALDFYRGRFDSDDNIFVLIGDDLAVQCANAQALKFCQGDAAARKRVALPDLLTKNSLMDFAAWRKNPETEPLVLVDDLGDAAAGIFNSIEWEITRDPSALPEEPRYLVVGKDISHVTMLEHLVRDSDRRLRRLFNDIPAMFFVMDRVGRISAVNDHWAAQLGYVKHDIIGRQCAAFMTKGSAAMMQRILHPQLLRDGRIIDARLDLRRQDGTTLETVFSAATERDSQGRVSEIYCVTNDVTRQNQAVAKTERQRRRFEAIVQDQSELICRFTPDGTLTFVNDAFCGFFDIDDDKLLGDSFFSLWPSPAALEIRDRLQKLQGGQGATSEMTLALDGVSYRLRVTERAITDTAGKIVEYQAVARDITEEWRARELLQDNEQRLRRIIDQMFVFVAILTPDGQVVEINRPPLEFAGIERIDVLGKPLWQVPWWQQTNAAIDQLREAVRLAGRGEPIRYDVTVRSKAQTTTILDFQISPLRDDQGAVTQLVASGVDVTARKEAEKKFEHAALHDNLTGLANRALFHIGLERENERLAREGGCLALMSLDLDRFKQVNDNFGHAVGDGLLKQVAERLKRCTRRTDILARLGGDEFAVVVSSKEAGEHLEMLARRIVDSINRPFEVDGHRVKIGVSLGLAVIEEACADVDELTNRSDMALYSAKETGRGTWQYYKPAMTERVRTRRRAEQDLADAIRSDQLELHYQPILSSNSNQLIGVEGLVRWNHPRQGIIPPKNFLGLAENLGLLNAIRSWVMQHALTQKQAWRHAGLMDVPISINLGRIGHDNDLLLDEIHRAIDAAGGQTRDLVVDFAESDVAAGSAVLGLIQHLEDAGIGVAIDDFGTGATSIARLGMLPATQLKIDGSILLSDKSSFDPISMVQAIVTIARANGMMTVMESVETEDQMMVAREAGCAAVQGYLLQRPVSADDFTTWLEQHIVSSNQAATRH